MVTLLINQGAIRGGGRTRPRNESSANNEAKLDVEKGTEEVAAERDRVPGVKAETRTEVRASSRQPPNWIDWFPKPDHSISSSSEQKGLSRTTEPRTTTTPHWCPPGLISSQRRRIQQMRA
jgi:hypothetical protein